MASEWPNNEEAERTILGAVLVEPVNIAHALTVLDSSDFYSTRNRLIFSALSGLFEASKAVDLVTLKEELGENLERAGGVAYLGGLLDGIPRHTNIDSWAEIVRHKSIQRRLISIADEIRQKASATETAEAAIDMAMAAVMSVADKSKMSGGFALPSEVAKEAFSIIETMLTTRDGVTGLKSGIEVFDTTLGGMKPHQLIVIAARPGMGKTACAVSMADNIVREGKRVGYFSLEMSREELTMRRFIKRSGLSIDALRGMKDKAYAKLSKVYEGISKDAFLIDDTPALTVQQIRARSRRLKAEKGSVDLIIVDYLQLAHSDKPENRQQEIATVARTLKDIAKELEVPVLALAQLNRNVEKQENKRPGLSDLRESGEIEQAADVIGFIYREHEYKADADPRAAELIIAKHRNGKLGTCRIKYVGELMTFSDLDPQIPVTL